MKMKPGSRRLLAAVQREVRGAATRSSVRASKPLLIGRCDFRTASILIPFDHP